MPLGAYSEFALKNWRFVGFGFVMTGASSFSQTFFVGIFELSVQQAFGLDHTTWGSIYMIGTLASALILP